MKKNSNLGIFNTNNKKVQSIFPSFSLLVERYRCKKVLMEVFSGFSKNYVNSIISQLSNISSKERLFKIRSLLIKSIDGTGNSVNFSGVNIVDALLSESSKYFFDEIFDLFNSIKKTNHYDEIIYELSGIIKSLPPSYFYRIQEPLTYLVKSTEPIYLKFALSHLFDILSIREDLGVYELSNIFQLTYHFSEENLIRSLIVSRAMKREEIASEKFFDDVKKHLNENFPILLY